MKTCTLTLALTLVSTLATTAAAQDATPAGCDPTNIEWVLPGDFGTARERAVAEQRMLLIKGISFGVDDVGATCATKGRW